MDGDWRRSKRPGGDVLARVGAIGIALTVLLFPAVYYMGLLEEDGFFDEIKSEMTGSALETLVPHIEFYRTQNGKYPDSLEVLGLALPEAIKGQIYDPASVLMDGDPELFYYEKVGPNHYYLLDLGPDGEPFTEDDIVPDIAVTPQGGTGLLIKGKEYAFIKPDITDYLHLGRNLASTALLDAAKNGNPDAQGHIGYMHEKGHGGFIFSNAMAIEWYEQAVAQGNPRAMGKLGLMYQEGRGVEQNVDKAFDLILRAAEAGDSEAQNNIGLMYNRGEGVAQDAGKAAEWYRRAADQGIETAQYNLALMYLQDPDVEKDVDKAYYWMSRAAYSGDLDAHNALGLMYRKGEVGEENIDRAIFYFAVAAGLGHAKAQINLGGMYLYGEGKLPVNQDMAVYLFRLAAQQGDEQAVEILSDLSEQAGSI